MKGVCMCEVMERIREDSKEEGRKEERLSILHNMIQHNFPKETIISLGYTEEEFSEATKNSNHLRTTPSRMEL